MFVDFLKAGLVERKVSQVNWDPVDQTVLANEQVIDGRGWRSGALVEKRELAQWFLKITDYSDELLVGARPARPLAGKSAPDAAQLDRPLGRLALLLRARGRDRQSSRRQAHRLHDPSRHDLRGELLRRLGRSSLGQAAWPKAIPSLAAFRRELRGPRHQRGNDRARREDAASRSGSMPAIPSGRTCRLPVYAANFVLMGYGEGAIFGCPAHDQRDLDFARKYGLPVIPVVAPKGTDPNQFAIGTEAFLDNEGDNVVMINSDFLDGMTRAEAKEEIARRFEKAGIGERKVNYRLRDWGVSRQRYWGCPIPVIHCAKCGVVPVPKQDLPVTLPEDVTFDKPGNPLAHHPTWKHVDLPDLRRQGRARDRHLRHLHRFLLVFRPLLLAACECPGRSARRPPTGCRSTSISAASSTRSCICSIRASTPAP